MNTGDRVEVNYIWAAAGGGQQPYRAWHRGYTFVRHEPNDNAIVCCSDGTFAGVEVRYRADDVRRVLDNA